MLLNINRTLSKGAFWTVWTTAIFFLAVSCSRNNKIPSGVLPVRKMKGILIDMLEASAYVNNSIRLDTGGIRQKKMKVMYRQILILHHTGLVSFLHSYSYYESHPDQMQVLYNSMSAVVTKEKQVIDSIIISRIDSLNKIQSDSIILARKDSLKIKGVKKSLPKNHFDE